MNVGLIIRKIIWYLMNFSSTLLVASLYFVKCQIIFSIFGYNWIDTIVTYSIFFGIPILLSIICIHLVKKICPIDSLQKPIKRIGSANKDYLPVYLSYFFVSLSIPNDDNVGILWSVLLVFIFIIGIFTSKINTYYFNPLLLLFGYKFYNVTSYNGIELFIISKRTIRKNDSCITFKKLCKVTEFVYIEIV